MKNALLISGFLFLASFQTTFAQSEVDDEITILQSAFGMDKKQIIEGYMDLPESVATNFWSVYQSYEAERTMIARERMKIINDFLTEYEVIGEEEADNLAKRTLKNDMELAKLHSAYYKKFKKATSALDAAKFMQIDTYIHNTIRNAMQQELPFIDQ
ncbi:hypothetical protein SAMN04489724_0543 [Algoriphagus locisalis]|uniref:Uncharacterized protein n=1 Tax=Algoriphagus locisalis TaxID=305507 RepID=A0A1I6XKS7_9BACT|nr:hypothetical protein [Algoriphagus locisalis]SFT38965.1 hypothetical protein SAMN04489724_0543 [Algoriphagus locisalis]